jgi:archaellum component FlaC
MRSSIKSQEFHDNKAEGSLDNMKNLDAFSTLRKDVYEYYWTFDRYRQQLIGNDLSFQESTNDPVGAKESLKDLKFCFCQIKNDIIILGRILNANHEYSLDEISNYNNNIVDISELYDSVNRRFHILKDQDELLVGIHNGFLESLAELNTLINKYNENRNNKLYSIPQALDLLKNNNLLFEIDTL